MDRINDAALRNLSMRWSLDGDLMRCRECGRSIIASRESEDMNHRSGCRYGGHVKPWAELKRAMFIAPSVTQEQAIEAETTTQT